MLAFIVMKCQSNLMQIVAATRPPRRFADMLHRGEQNRHQNGDDGNHDQDFDKRERATFAPRSSILTKKIRDRMNAAAPAQVAEVECGRVTHKFTEGLVTSIIDPISWLGKSPRCNICPATDPRLTHSGKWTTTRRSPFFFQSATAMLRFISLVLIFATCSTGLSCAAQSRLPIGGSTAATESPASSNAGIASVGQQDSKSALFDKYETPVDRAPVATDEPFDPYDLQGYGPTVAIDPAEKARLEEEFSRKRCDFDRVEYVREDSKSLGEKLYWSLMEVPLLYGTLFMSAITGNGNLLP